MLPVEYKPCKQCLELFHKTVQKTAEKVALAAATAAEVILKLRGPDLVLASLARAGTPAGILIKRYLAEIRKIEVPHYTLSILRVKGFDENAVRYIIENNSAAFIQFVDGWTGKGAIADTLLKACSEYRRLHGYELNPELAVIADPGFCTRIFGTREDFLIPSACLNATVSGLISRTFYHKDLIGFRDFHGVRYTKQSGAPAAEEILEYVKKLYYHYQNQRKKKESVI